MIIPSITSEAVDLEFKAVAIGRREPARNVRRFGAPREVALEYSFVGFSQFMMGEFLSK